MEDGTSKLHSLLISLEKLTGWILFFVKLKTTTLMRFNLSGAFYMREISLCDEAIISKLPLCCSFLQLDAVTHVKSSEREGSGA